MIGPRVPSSRDDCGRGVLLTDGEERSVLAAARGLASVGYYVAVAASRRPAVTHWSRSTAQRHWLPDPRVDAEAFVREAAALVARHSYRVIIPGSEPSLLALSEHRDQLGREIAIGLPPHEVVLRCLDKRALIEIASATSLEVPRSLVCSGRDAAIEAGSRLGYPVVIKPHRSQLVCGDSRAVRYQPSVVARTEAELRKLLHHFCWPTIVQRYEPTARVISFGGVRAADDIVAAAFSRYERTWPVDAGSASFSETIEVPRNLMVATEDLVRRLEWQGIFELELLERSDGSYAAIDFNPRLYGSIAVAIAAGANLPALWTDWLMGRRVEPARSRPGMRYRLEEAELRNAMTRVGEGHPFAAVRILLPRRRVTHALFRWNDPGPFVASVAFRSGHLAARGCRFVKRQGRFR